MKRSLGESGHIVEKRLDVASQTASRSRCFATSSGASIELAQYGGRPSFFQDLLGSNVEERLRRIGVGEVRANRDPVIVGQTLADVSLWQPRGGGDRRGPDQVALDVAAAPTSGLEAFVSCCCVIHEVFFHCFRWFVVAVAKAERDEVRDLFLEREVELPPLFLRSGRIFDPFTEGRGLRRINRLEAIAARL